MITNKRNYKYNSINRKILIIVIVLAILLTTFIVSCLMYWDYRKEISTINSTFEHIKKSVVPNIELAIWNINIDQINTLLQSTLSQPMVVKSNITGTNINLSEEKSILDYQKYDNISYPIYKKYTLKYDGELIGYLHLTADKIFIYRNLIDKGIRIFLIQFLYTSLFLILIMLVFKQIIINDLFLINKFLQHFNFKSTQKGDRLILQRSLFNRGKDELTDIAYTINEFSKLIVEYNISEKKKFDFIEQQVIERTMQLAEEKQKAEVANIAKSEFLSNMSHEIRTPMNAIIGFSEIIMEKTLNQKMAYFSEAINTSGKCLLSLINNILDLSKVEAGQLHLEYDAVLPHSY